MQCGSFADENDDRQKHANVLESTNVSWHAARSSVYHCMLS